MTENGLDPRVLRVLQIDPADAVAYIRENLPSYPQFEAWVLEQNEGEIDREKADEWNTFIRNRIHRDEKRIEIHATVGREDDGTLTSAVLLNHIEDWHLAHADLMKALTV